MADILFITPSSDTRIFSESVGTLLLTTILRGHGLHPQILRFAEFGDPRDFQTFLSSAVQKITAERPKIVSFYTRCDSYHIMLKIAGQIKARTDAYIVFGGPHADISAVETLRQIPYVDFICCGEGESTVYPLFSSLLRGEPDLTIPGLVFRRDGQVVKNPRPELIQDLDTLPFIDYSGLRYEGAADSQDPFPIDVGRGCPFGCTYCSTKSFWGRKYRLKSPRRIVDELAAVHEQFGFSYFAFEHDMFTMARRQVVETCELLKELDFPVSWRCSARIDCLDRELIDIMADAGLKTIYIGIETGSPRMQKIINKNLKLDSVMDKLSYIHSKNIGITASFIYGFPEETEADISQTMALIGRILQLDGIQVQTHLCTFLPATELSEKYLPELSPATSYSDITGSAALEECADLISAHPDLFRHFREYRTELRAALEYFPIFFRIWSFFKPVYTYLSEKYPPDRLIDMYYDFVRANGALLAGTGQDQTEQGRRLLKDDHFPELFKDDENYDIITDYYRIRAARSSDALNRAGTAMEIYCFSPLEIQRCPRLQDYRRSITVASYTKNPDGTVSIRIQS